jgi:hypothetical protein
MLHGDFACFRHISPVLCVEFGVMGGGTLTPAPYWVCIRLLASESVDFQSTLTGG